MGTVFTIAAYGPDAAYLEDVMGQVFEEMDRLDDQMSGYKPASELSGINRGAARHAVAIEPELFKLIEDCLHYSRETGGAFDITVGPLMKAWGFFRGEGRLPSCKELQRVMQSVGYWRVRLDKGARSIQFKVAGLELDLGGIGKGYAVNRAAVILRENGVDTALISSGTSSLCAMGSPPGERDWRISMRDPVQPEKSAATLRLRNVSLSVSGNYEQFFRFQGKTYSHIIDPRRGLPAEGVLSVAVISPSATESEALSTAFFVMGAEGSREYVTRHPSLTAIMYPCAERNSTSRELIVQSRIQALPLDAVIGIFGRQAA